MKIITLSLLVLFFSMQSFADCSGFASSQGVPLGGCAAACQSSCNYATCVNQSADNGIPVSTIPFTWQATDSNCSQYVGTPNTLAKVGSESQVFNDGTIINQTKLPMQVYLGHSGSANSMDSSVWACVIRTNTNTTPCPINGVCGSDDGQPLGSPPSNTCSAGIFNNLSGSGPWTWTCDGQYGGTTANCATGAYTPPCTAGATVVLLSATYGTNKSIQSFSNPYGLSCYTYKCPQGCGDANDAVNCTGNIPNIGQWYWGCDDSKIYYIETNNSVYPGDWSGSGHNGSCPGAGFKTAPIGVSGGAVTEMILGARNGGTVTIYGVTSCP